jgi:hypothetical protein
MSPKFVLILYYLLPFAVFGQARATRAFPIIDSAPLGRANILPVSKSAPGWLSESISGNYTETLPRPFDEQKSFEQPAYREPISIATFFRPEGNKMEVSAAGGVIYTERDDVFAYTHYGRTGKLIWRTSPIANNIMATRWSLANFSIFRRTALTSISSQLR